MAAARKLLRRAERDRRKEFLVEGPTLVREALEAGAGVKDVFLAEDVEGHGLEAAIEEAGVPAWTVGMDVIAALSETVTPQGAVAVVTDPSVELDALSETDLCLVLADVRDPGNAGTLVRTAAAAGAGGVVFAAGSVDPLHPKVVRSASGALFRVPIVRHAPLAEVAATLRAAGMALVGTAADAPTDVYSLDLTGPVAVVLGNEAWGLPEAANRLLDERVAIPMPGPVESLNVSIAGAILLFEILRQRVGTSGPGLSSASDE